MKRHAPTGGVTSPVVMDKMNTRPKCRGSKPISIATGWRIGPSRMMIPRISMNIPANRRSMIIIKRIIVGLEEKDSNTRVTLTGISLRATNQVKIFAVATIIKTIEVSKPLSINN
jgi:hypothetical protein